MGYWSYYFFAKLFLFFGKYIGFNIWPNLLFALALLVPVRNAPWTWMRQLVATIIGISLLYHDSWLPPIERVFSQSKNLEGFSLPYVIELVSRLVDIRIAAALMLGYLLYLLLGRRLRMSSFAILGIVLAPLLMPFLDGAAKNSSVPAANASSAAIQQNTPPEAIDDITLSAALKTFHEQERTRRVAFPEKTQAATDFDVIFLHVCSLAWDDLDFIGERNNPLLQRFDVVFQQFNSAASYSGPSVIRLLRANCGQASHLDLYGPPGEECSLMRNFERAGFKTQLLMNHDGRYGDFLADVRERGGLNVTPEDNRNSPVAMRSFDDSPIYDDYSLLKQWSDKQSAEKHVPRALYYNSISLHDGNKLPGARAGNSMATYPTRVKKLLQDFGNFFNDLEKSGRNVVVVFIPEHGASVRGDKMQISGMREIPSRRITQIPVGIKLIGAAFKPAGKPQVLNQPVSYLGLSAVLNAFISQSPFGPKALPLSAYLQDIPSTQPVSENDNLTMMRRGERDFMLSPGASWVEYEAGQ
jgi:cellulose synthase operon protein YhjU